MNKLFSEFLGTFILIFCGTGAIIIDQQSNGSVTHVGVAITFGLIVMSLIYTLGDISGSHINPAVTIAFTIAKRFPLKQLLPYIISQLLGGLLASGILKLLFPSNVGLGGTLPAGSETQSFILEFLLTFILMLVIINVATGIKEQGMYAGIAIGSVVLLEAMFAGPICGASMNPVRSISPALISRNLEHLWIYIFAPIGGAALAIPIHQILHYKIIKNENSPI